MRRVAILLLLTCSVARAQKPVATAGGPLSDPVAVARSFLPPNSRLARLYAFDFRVGRVSRRWPAVLQAHVVSSDARDIVFAYYTPAVADGVEKTLFVDLLHLTPQGYQKLYELSYRDQVFLIPQAMRVLHLKGEPTDALATVTGIGAALGGRLDIFVWREPRGWQNILPTNSTGYTYFFPQQSGLVIALSTASHPGLNVSPPPEWYEWDGKRFVKIPPPVRSSTWPLPD